MTMAHYRNNHSNKTKVITFWNLLVSPLKLLLLAVLIVVGNPKSLLVAATKSPPPPCLTGWSHLSLSHICIRLHAGGSALYADTSRLCSTAAEDDQTGVSPLLLSFQSVETGDFHTLDTVVGNGIHQLWFHVAEASPQQQPPLVFFQETTSFSSMNYSSCLAIRNRTTGLSGYIYFFIFYTLLCLILFCFHSVNEKKVTCNFFWLGALLQINKQGIIN